MDLLVTGGCGFIGSNFVRFMLERHPDYGIINLDKLTYAGNPENLGDVAGEYGSRYRFVEGDVCDKSVVEELVGDVDAVINFAAETHVDRSIREAGSFVLTDVYGTYVLLEACKMFDKKLVQISTDEVYGSIGEGSFSEEDGLAPNNPYSASKAGADLLVRAYLMTHGLAAVIARSSNTYGPHQHPEKMIPLFTTNLLSGRKVPLYGDGANVRDWLYVADNCESIDVILHKGRLGETYNVGGGCEKTNLEVTREILSLLGKDESSIEYVEDRRGHDRRYSLETAKIRELGWKPETPFSEGLRQTVEWYKNNERWWRPLVKKGE